MANIDYRTPGVYLEELPSGTRPIEVAGTSTAVFVGYASGGATNTPIAIERFREYEEQFQSISAGGNDPGDVMALSVRAFFANGGRRAYIVNATSADGEKSSGALQFGRGQSAQPLGFLARDRGRAGDEITVVLTPRDAGTFSLVVRGPGTRVETRDSLILAPGTDTASDLMNFVNASRWPIRCNADDYEKLTWKVYPSVILDTAALKALLTATTVRVDEKDQGTFSFSETPTPAEIEGAINQCLQRTQYKVKCRPNEKGGIQCAFITTDLSIELALSSDGAAIGDYAGTRRDLLGELIEAVDSDQAKQAVLSGNNTQFKATALREQTLAVRVGDEFGREMDFGNWGGADTSLAEVAKRMQDKLRQACRPPLPRVRLEVRNGKKVVILDYTRFEAASPLISATPKDVLTKPVDKKAEWVISLAPTGSVTFTFGLGSISPTKSLELVKQESLKDFVEAFTSAANAAATPSDSKIRVEAIEGRLLLWHDNESITVLDSPAAQLLGLAGTSARKDALSAIQKELPIVVQLAGGRNDTKGVERDYQGAIDQLEQLSDASIVCLPGNEWDSPESRAIVQMALQHAERQQDRMVIVDPPRTAPATNRWTTEDEVELSRLPTSSFCAVYYPWLNVALSSGNVVPVPPCGFAAGIWSRTDESRGVWKAPAGIDARIYGAESLLHVLTEQQSGSLNVRGVNSLRDIRGSGQVVWGARTRATLVEPQWRYLSVRRTALMIEDSLREALLWAVHQPNRFELWSSLRVNIEAFMSRLFRAGAFQPDSPRDAYFVRCGLGSTMVQADIDAGIVRVAVGFAPVKPAEFVVITIEQSNEASR